MAALFPLALAACETPPPTAEDFIPEYKGVETKLLEGDLVQFNVAMTKAQSTKDVANYARCAAAQYTLIRGYGFARHVRTNVSQEGSIWRADAVYTISPSLPRGLRTIDAEVTAQDCVERGIPTV
ncbi:hypothetical protein C8N31_102263 [Sulfitobacter mediterraneus]|uniref:Lipoprotein n=1 Tax=Sulfitobacter mediterraneus TaxID=83219 RepID=A0A2T6CI43_9RHOB|nr:hypothetical protein [Sulfitobacter mediterraneus]KIN76660.1 putative, lipoprotein [Sulfitobacter mediterraneus KCTC 32188]PTX75158.1 hypothetical protein C8N31_102263 [Sulfitobacter mediterraneus]